MSTNAATATAFTRESRATALSLRRWFLIAAPVLAGLFAVVGAAADPAVGEEGRTLWEKYAANPDALQWKSFGFHWSYAFWTIAAFVLAGAVRARGVWLANVAALLAFVGATTLPGLLVIDFYDSAIGQAAGVETTEQVDAVLQGMWGIKAIAIPGLVGALLCLPLATLAATRAGLLRWWAFPAALGAVAVFMLSGVTVWGTIAATVLFGVLAYAVARSRVLAA